jgi:hypothetical protein
MYVGARQVKGLPDFKLLILFENGERRLFDISSYLDHGVFRDLRDPAMFNSARISFDSVAWANGADVCPEVLYRESVPVRDMDGSRETKDSQQPRPETGHCP